MRGKPMTLMHRLRTLRTRHAELDNRIRDELARPLPDDLRTQTLKRMRLRTKDQIALVAKRLSSHSSPGQPEAA